MRDIRVATRYADALLASAHELDVVAGVAESYAAVLDVVLADKFAMESMWSSLRWVLHDRRTS